MGGLGEPPAVPASPVVSLTVRAPIPDPAPGVVDLSSLVLPSPPCPRAPVFGNGLRSRPSACDPYAIRDPCAILP
ncbi:hypothetical protein GCM10027160_43530 [Streptomyces calidiresistens]